MEWEDITPQGSEDAGEGEAGWITTFSDMMSLLLTFFILLFSISSVETVKFKQILESIQSALGVENVPEAGTREGLEMVNIEAQSKTDAVDEFGGMVKKELNKIKSSVEEFIEKNQLNGHVSVKVDDRGAVITISDFVLFPEGSATFTPSAKPILKKMTPLLKQFPYLVRVEGHTDNLPISNSKYPSNWELSAARAAGIVRFYVRNGIDPHRLVAVGYAEFRPIADNSTPEGREKNRRVEIVYVREDVRKKLSRKINIIATVKKSK